MLSNIKAYSLVRDSRPDLRGGPPSLSGSWQEGMEAAY